MTDRPSAPKRTRVALRIAAGPCPAYLAAAVESVLAVDDAAVVLLVTAARGAAAWPPPGRLETLYERLERLALPGARSAFASVPGPVLPADVTTVPDTDADALSEAMRDAAVDVLIDLAPGPDAGSMPIPPGGRWRLRYAAGIDEPRRASLSRPATATALVPSLLSIDGASGQRFEAETGISAVQRIGFARSRDAVYWRSSRLPARRLARMAAGATVPADGVDVETPANDPNDGRGSARPGSGLPPFVGLAIRLLRKVVERVVFRTGWLVLVRSREAHQPPPRDLAGFRAVEAPAGRFFADPFVVAMPDGPRLYVEDCPDGRHEGRISVLRPADDNDGWTTERVALHDLDHRAYPHVLRVDDGWLVTPDSGRNGGVDLFLDPGDGGGLRRVGHALEGVPASDPTLLWHDGLYWLFVTVTGAGMSPWEELHVYSTESIAGLWHPHPRNPVVADVRRARPAGRIFQTEDGLIRPGQDCSVEYGQRIVLSAITSLSTTDYEEHPIASIEPAGIPGIRRTHTYTFDGTTEALDGYRRTLRRPRLRRSHPAVAAEPR